MFIENSSQPQLFLPRFLPALFLLLFLFSFLSSFSAFAGPVQDGISSVGSSLAEYEPLPISPPKDSSSILEDDSQHLVDTSEASLSAQYKFAKELLYTRHFSEAESVFLSLGTYADSQEFAALCRSYPASEIEFENKLMRQDTKNRLYSDGAIYWCTKGPFYVPDNVTSSTSFVLYYCGGDGAKNWLSYSGVFQYFKTYHPDAIIFFCNGPGATRLEEENIHMYHYLQEIARECGVIVHDLSAIGSSTGCYTALNAAASLFDAFGIRLTNVCSLDAAADWDSWGMLTPAEMDSVAEAGTVFFLFEQHGAGTRAPQLQSMLDHGINTWLILCSSANHSAISTNAFNYGVFSWSAGEPIDLPYSEYVFTHLTPSLPFPPQPIPSPPLIPMGKDSPLLTAG